MTAEDALAFMIAGAGAFAIGTALFADVQAPEHIIAGLEDYLARHKIKHVSDLVGTIELPE